MHLNDLSPAAGSRKAGRRIGRGTGSGNGKTAGKGHKGQKARKSGNVRPGFEGGQLPLQMRVPKFGFRSRVGMSTAEVRLSELAKVEGDVVSIDGLKSANVLKRSVKRARVVLSGAIDRAVTVKGIKVTRGARAAIEAAGGKVED
jgi:large subunit ribosomal protein L15